MSTVYQCLKQDDRYTPPIRRIVFEAATEQKAIDWLESNGGGIYRNILHNFDCPIKAR